MDHLKPGEMYLGGECSPGVRHYARRLDDGSYMCGHAASAESGLLSGHAEGCIELEPPTAGDGTGIRRVKQDIKYTARGPARVSSDRYRSGWDAVYGRKELS